MFRIFGSSLYLAFSIQVSKLFMFYVILLIVQQFMDRSTVLEHMITHRVVFLRWNQRTAQGSYTGVRFS